MNSELDTRRIEAAMQAAYAQEDAAHQQARPFVLLRPRMFPDGNQWCALYGDNLQEGVSGFGDTPALAASDFDKEWVTRKLGAPVAVQPSE